MKIRVKRDKIYVQCLTSYFKINLKVYFYVPLIELLPEQNITLYRKKYFNSEVIGPNYAYPLYYI